MLWPSFMVSCTCWSGEAVSDVFVFLNGMYSLRRVAFFKTAIIFNESKLTQWPLSLHMINLIDLGHCCISAIGCECNSTSFMGMRKRGRQFPGRQTKCQAANNHNCFWWLNRTCWDACDLLIQASHMRFAVWLISCGLFIYLFVLLYQKAAFACDGKHH